MRRHLATIMFEPRPIARRLAVTLGQGRFEVSTVEEPRPVELEKDPASGRSIELSPGCLCTKAELLQFRGCTCAPRDEEPLG